MDDDFIVTVYVVIDEMMRALEHRDHPLAVIMFKKNGVIPPPWRARQNDGRPISTLIGTPGWEGSGNE